MTQQSSVPADEGRVPAWLLAAFFVSGAAGLVYEVAWSKVLSYTFGNSLFAISTVVSAFFGGLAIGAYLLGPPLSRRRNRISRYAALECIVALLGLISIPALNALEPLFIALHRSLLPTFAMFVAIRFVIVFLVLLLPTAMMGATLPLLVAHAEGKRFGGALSRLYAVNTFGAVAGTLGAALLFIPAFGLIGSTVVAALGNLAAAAIAWLRRSDQNAPAAASAAEAPDTPAAGAAAAASPTDAGAEAAIEAAAPTEERLPGAAFLIGLVALSGFAALLLEVTWTRILTLVIGSSVISFALVLGFYLLGIAGGSAIIARRLARLKRPLLLFAYLELALAVFVLTHLFIVPELPGIFLKTMLAEQMNLLLYLGSQGAIIALMVIPPCLLLGAIFPISARLLYQHDPGRATGLTYFVNTAGTILGSIATGFILIPWLGSQKTIILGALFSGAVGLAALLRAGSALAKRLTVAALAVAAGAALIVSAPQWNNLILTSGVFRPVAAASVALASDPNLSGRERLEQSLAEAELIMYKEGINTPVSLIRSRVSGELFLKIGGKTDASTGDIETQLLSGHIPMMFAPDSARVMVIGQGSGMTLASVLKQGAASAEIVEIEEAVLEASRSFHPKGQDPLDDPRTISILEDGRTRLMVASEPYDVIISEPSNPWLAGNNNLFTKDFYELVRSRLTPNGVFGQWIQLYEISETTFASLLAAFRSVFPSSYAFVTAGVDLILVAAPQEGETHLERLRDPVVRDDLLRVNLDPPEEILSYFMCKLDELPPRLLRGRANTDNNAFVEYRAPIDLFRIGRRDFLSGGAGQSLVSLITLSRDVPFAEGFDPKDLARWRAYGLAQRERFDWAETAVGWMNDLQMHGAVDTLNALIADLKIEARHNEVATLVANYKRADRLDVAEQELKEQIAQVPNDYVLIFNLGLLYMQAGRLAEADSIFTQVIDNNAAAPLVRRAYNNRGIIAARTGDREGAVSLFHAARTLRPKNPESYLYEAQVLSELGRLDAALTVIEAGIAAIPNNPVLLQSRQNILAAQ